MGTISWLWSVSERERDSRKKEVKVWIVLERENIERMRTRFDYGMNGIR